MQKAPCTDKADDYPKYQFGTRLVRNWEVFRYIRAGSDLKKGQKVYIHPPEIPITNKGEAVITDKIQQSLWGDIRASEDSNLIQGISVIDVKRGQFCWIRVFGEV